MQPDHITQGRVVEGGNEIKDAPIKSAFLPLPEGEGTYSAFP